MVSRRLEREGLKSVLFGSEALEAGYRLLSEQEMPVWFAGILLHFQARELRPLC